MPPTLMKQLSELKLTGMATVLSAQMEQPGTNEPALLVSTDCPARSVVPDY